MSSAILMSVVKLAASEIFSAIKKNIFKPASDGIDEILKGQEQIKDLIKEVSHQVALRESMNLIYYWTNRMGEILDEMERNNQTADDSAAYQELMSALRSESSGIRFQTFCVYTAISGLPGPLGGEGYLGFWDEQAYKKLSDPTDSKYTLKNYVDDLDSSLEAVARLLRHGLMLSLFVASDEVDANKLRDDCGGRITFFQTTLYDTYYPIGLRELKPSGYNDRGEQHGQWYRLDKEGASKRLRVTRQMINEIVVGSGNDSDKSAGFQFIQDTVPLGLLQMVCGVDDRGNRRVNYYDRVGNMGMRERAWSTNTDKTWSALVLFKWIPIDVNREESRWSLRLAPFIASTGRAQDDGRGTFGAHFTVRKIASPI